VKAFTSLSLAPPSSIRCTSLLACSCDCARRRPLHFLCRYHGHGHGHHTSHISLLSRSRLVGRRCSNPHAHHSPSTFPTQRGLHRPGCERTCVCINDSIISFLFLSGTLSTPSSRSFILYKYRRLEFTVLGHDCTLSITHGRCVRLTFTCQSLDLAPEDGLCLVTPTCSFPSSRHCIHSRSRSL